MIPTTASEQKQMSGRTANVQFILTGFTQDVGFRVFAFEHMGIDRIRIQFQVRADLALIRRYGIRVQELPLLCRGLLERRGEGEERHAFTYTEDDMRVHATDRAARDETAQKKRSPRRPPSENIGNAWRGPQPQ